MLSILKNKENIATQILNQFDVDYDLFRNELGVVKSNDVRSEYAEENDDDFDEEKSIRNKNRVPQALLKAKLLFSIISGGILQDSRKAAHSTR